MQTVAGLGLGLLTAPAVALVAPSYVPALPLFLALVISGSMLAGERHHVDWGAIAWSLPARLPGTAVGAWLVLHFTETQIGVALAVMVLLAVAVSLRAVAIPVTPVSLSTAGFVAGISGTATSIGGPPLALLFQRRDPEVVRSTLSVFFFVGILLSLGGLALTGHPLRDAFVVALLCAPGVLLGLAVGTRLRARLPRETFRLVVLAVCALSALVLLGRSLLG